MILFKVFFYVVYHEEGFFGIFSANSFYFSHPRAIVWWFLSVAPRFPNGLSEFLITRSKDWKKQAFPSCAYAHICIKDCEKGLVLTAEVAFTLSSVA